MPHPRIWIAGQAEAPVRRAGRLGHAFYALGTLTHDALRQRLDVWRAALREHGHRPPGEVPILREVFVAPTRAEAWRRARPGVEAKYEAYARHGLSGVAEALAGGVDRLMRDPFIIGDPEECLDRLARCHELGVTHVGVRLFWPAMTQTEVLRMIELVGTRIIPSLDKLEPGGAP
jgi:alkanesulfonate monooxygenase SsuD/methylene tetrahydromethanopterin reductase-like flavin-dependent oxidoreductase (luciferase family)